MINNFKYLYFKIVMFDLKQFSKTPVTLLKKTSSRKNNIDIILRMIKEGKASVFTIYENDKSVKYINTYFQKNHPEIKTAPLINQKKISSHKDVYFSDFSSAKNIFLRNVDKLNVDFCSVIIINDIHFEHSDKMFLILLWLHMFQKSDNRPYLLLTTDCYLIPEIPFDLKKISLQELEKEEEKEDIKYIYHNENYSPNSFEIITKTVEIVNNLNTEYPLEGTQQSTWLVFYSGKKNSSHLTKLLYDSLDDCIVYSYKNISDFSKIIKEGKRTIIVIDQIYEDNIFLTSDGVIDSMISEYKDEESIFYKYSSHQRSDIKSSYVKKGFCYRLCTQTFYETLPKVEINTITGRDLEKYILNVSEKDINIQNFFQNLVQKSKINKCIQKLKFLGCLNSNDKITSIGKSCLRLPLSITNCCILEDWKKDHPIFPMLVLLVFTEITDSIIYFPYKNKSQSNDEYRKTKINFIKENYNETYSSILELYLKIFVQIVKDEGTVNITNFNRVCKKYKLNYLIMREVFTKIKKIVDLIEEKFELGIFNPENLIGLSKQYFEKYSFNNVGKLIDQEKRLYSFSDSSVYKLDYFKHFGKKEELPYHIVVFEKIKINDSEDSIQKRKNLIYYFMPLDNLFVEN